MPTYRLDLSWDGSHFCGWQRQSDVDSIQGAIELALTRLYGGEKICVQAAGRTDAGVHALQQIASFHTEGDRSENQIMRALNVMTPRQIVCLSVQTMPDDFQARSGSKEKMYRYRILHRKFPCPFRYLHTLHVKRSLDVEAMKTAATYFIGSHDFSFFRSQGCTANTTIRTISSAKIVQEEDEIHFEVQGKGFLRHQVRIMMGILLEVGLGNRTSSSVLGLLKQKDREGSWQTAPAYGLWLVWTSLLDKKGHIQ
jgi:tRNA pseudouridine38-40 synthase